MRKRPINKILLPLVLIIWVGVILRFWDGCQMGDDLSTNTNNTQSLSLPDLQKDSDYSLVLNYRDPYLDSEFELKRKRPPVSTPSTPQLTRVEIKKPPISLPTVVYQGGVQNNDVVNMTGLISLEGKLYQVQAGDSVMGLYISRLNFESVWLVRADTSWVVRRK